MKKIVITFADNVPLTAKEVEYALQIHFQGKANVDMTTTPESTLKGNYQPANIDIVKGVEYTDIALTGKTFTVLESLAKDAGVPIEQILRRGAEKLAIKEKNNRG